MKLNTNQQMITNDKIDDDDLEIMASHDLKDISKAIAKAESKLTMNDYVDGEIPLLLVGFIVSSRREAFAELLELTGYDKETIMYAAIKHNKLLTLEYYCQEHLLSGLDNCSENIYKYTNEMVLKQILKHQEIRSMLQRDIHKIVSRGRMDILKTLYKNDIRIHGYMIYEFVKMLLSRQFYRELCTLNEYDSRVIKTIEDIYVDDSAKCLHPHLDKFHNYLVGLSQADMTN